MDYSFKYLFVLLALFRLSAGIVSNRNLLQTMEQNQDLKTFGSWCRDTLPYMYGGSGIFTIFAFNDTSFRTMPSAERAILTQMTQEQKKDYVQTYTITTSLKVESLRDGSVLRSVNGKDLFITKKNRYQWGAGGTTGLQATYMNGGMVVSEMIQCSNGIIHVIDRPLLPISNKNVFAWISEPDPQYNIQTTKFKELTDRLYQDNYQAISPVSMAEQVTFFLPSDDVLRKIPSNKLQSLRGDELANYFRMHYIPNKAVFTSTVTSQESAESGFSGSRILFMTQDDRVLVKSGGVTAMIIRGNITCSNGVIHIIDRMFGFVYNSAREQIQQDAPRFSNLLDGVSPEIQSLITQPSGVNLFVPTDDAFTYIQNMPWINIDQNNTLKDFIVRLCLVRDGSVEISQLNGNYDVRQRRFSRYNDWKLVVYNDRNDTWVNGGNVRAKITRPDIKVTTGRLQYIDSILGIPSMDIPTLIYYDDYLLRTYDDMYMCGLDTFLKDPRYDPSMLPPRSFTSDGLPNNNYGTNNGYYTTQYPGQQTQWPGQQQTQWPGQQQTQWPGQQQTQWPGQNNQNNNNQYPNNNNQYPNNNNQYPNNNNQYPNNNNQQGRSSYGTCGDRLNVCQFTVFVPNGTAIYNYRMSSLGNRIVNDVNRYRWVFRRLIIPNNLIFLEQLPVSPQSYRYTTHTGETILVKKETDNIVRITWGSQSARVIMWDLGATNGVVHIIDTVLSDMSDIDRDVSRASGLVSQQFTFIITLAVILSVSFMRKLFP